MIPFHHSIQIHHSILFCLLQVPISDPITQHPKQHKLANCAEGHEQTASQRFWQSNWSSVRICRIRHMDGLGIHTDWYILTIPKDTNISEAELEQNQTTSQLQIYLPSHYITMTQFQDILIIFLAWEFVNKLSRQLSMLTYIYMYLNVDEC